jgi:hypothetical protein
MRHRLHGVLSLEVVVDSTRSSHRIFTERLTVRTERWTGIAGLVLVSSVIGGIVFETLGPNVSMTPDQMAASFKSGQVTVGLATTFLLIQKVVLVGFAVGLATLAARGEKDHTISRLILVSGTLQVAITMVYVATFQAIASVAGQLPAAVVFGLATVGENMDLAGMPFLGLMIASAGYGLARAGVLPRWVGRFGLVAGGLLILGSFSLIDPQSFFLMLPLLLAILLTVIWVPVASIALILVREPVAAA